MSLTDYLAKNYLTADTPSHKKDKTSSSKKRKRTHKAGLQIADDDLFAGSTPNSTSTPDRNTATIAGQTSEFRKAKSSAWKSIGAPTPKDDEQKAADAILASAAAESASRTALDESEDGPQVVGEDEDDDGPTMGSGAAAGLQSAAAVTAQMERKARKERERYEADPSTSGMGQETIYRDASGRIINVAMKRAEARRAQEEKRKKEREEREAMRGDVQNAEREGRKREVEEAKYKGVARYADDVEMNEELKERGRWDDPAAQFLTKRKEGKSVTGKPLYKGSAAPNRYGIRPGYRWDGVDRSNGWEKEYFAKRNERESIKNLKYQWEMDE